MDGEEEPRPGNWDRAWNDPPLFSYKADSKPPAAGLKLNKRVHHSVESGITFFLDSLNIISYPLDLQTLAFTSHNIFRI